VDDLIAFLRARLDEAEAVINRNLGDDGLGDSGSYPDYSTWDDGDTKAADEYLREFNPKRMLAEVDAKRKIIELHVIGGSLRAPVTDNKVYVCDLCGPDEWPDIQDGEGNWVPVPAPPNGGDFYPCTTLRLMALPYAGHPDYRAEWRP
jgi:Family of unknown function (DUF6221)